LYMASMHADSLMHMYSSTRSPATPYASICIAAEHFSYEEKPSLPVASGLHLKYGSWRRTPSMIHPNNFLDIRKRRRK
jgi:hypothetical protein